MATPATRIITSEAKLPSPKRIHVLQWQENIRNEFSVFIVLNSFTGSGYYDEDEIDYSGGTGIESVVIR